MEKRSIENIIKCGESQDIEYKVTKPSDNTKYLKTVVAFSNGQGGTIVFGIDDKTHDLVGISEDVLFPMMDSIINSISDGITPQIVPDISPITVKGKNLIILKIPSGGTRPYYIKSLGLEHGVFARIGNTTREADGNLKKELYFENINRSFDSEPYGDKSLSEKDILNLCELMYKEAKKNAKNEVLANLVKPVTVRQLLSWDIVRMKEDKIFPNNAYAILSGDDGLPISIKCACFKGTTPVNFLDANEFSGFVGNRIDEAFKFVLRNIHKGIGFSGLHHYDDYEIPTLSLREAIINAIAHRSYIPFDDTKIAVFDDRIEINSPGKMPFGQTIEEMIIGHSMIRNKALAQAFSYMNLIEEWGSGIPRIFEECNEYGLKKPVLRDLGVSFKLTIYRPKNYAGKVENNDQSKESGTISGTKNCVSGTKKVISGTTSGTKEDISGTLIEVSGTNEQVSNITDSEKRILRILKEKNNISALYLANKLGISDRGVRKILSKLKEKGLVKKNRKTRNANYQLTEEGVKNA